MQRLNAPPVEYQRVAEAEETDVECRHGIVANLLYRWRRLMSEGAAVAVSADESEGDTFLMIST
jgi:transposase-like protein